MAGNNNNKNINGAEYSSNLQYWTNEKHVRFLNSMEASFVRSMFVSSSSPPLDRYLPDTSDSTQDLGMERRRRRHSTSDIDGKTRNSLSHISCQDQVVPQVQKRGDDKDKDEKDHLRNSIALRTAH